MKTKKLCRIPILLTLLSGSVVLGQGGPLDLYLQPDIHSRRVESVRPDDPRLGQPAPVMDEAKAALGWHFASFRGQVDGFVPDAKIGKDMLPVDNTIIRAGADDSSAALGVYSFGDPIEIIDTGLWWKVRLESTFPVYFLMETLPPASLAGGDYQMDVTQEGSIPSTGIVDDSVFFNSTVEPAPGGTPPVSIVEQSREPRIGVVARSYTGTLRKSKAGIGFFRPKAPYHLDGENGKRLVWVDFGEVIMPGSINQYIGRDVIIHGEPVQDEKSGDRILHVRAIREIL